MKRGIHILRSEWRHSDRRTAVAISVQVCANERMDPLRNISISGIDSNDFTRNFGCTYKASGLRKFFSGDAILRVPRLLIRFARIASRNFLEPCGMECPGPRFAHRAACHGLKCSGLADCT